VVVITGASQGIGKATAVAAAREGARVAVCDIADTKGVQTVEEIRNTKGDATYFHLDVSRETEVSTVFKEIREKLGPIYGLVNNAAVTGTSKQTHEIDESDWDAVFRINVKGCFFCTKHAVRQMLEQGHGSIVNISSVHGIVSSPDVPPYHASKGAIRIMTKTDALSYARKGIRVNSVHPGFIDTSMGRGYARAIGGEEAVFGEFRRTHPIGRLGRPEEIAAGVIFLLSDDASYMTGSELVMDGGTTAQ
jgi:NAD(P)-dependent dehydrogenase (short-subunit alcohol dehydrogenase family)